MNPTIRRSQIACMNMHYKRYSLDYFLNSVQRIGYESVAFWGGPPHFSIDSAGYEDTKALRKKFAAHGLSCISFTTPALLPPNQFAMDIPEHIEDTYRYFTNGVRVSSELGATVMIANSGYGLKTCSQADAWARSRDMLRRISEFAVDYGVTLTVESLRPTETNLVVTLEDTRRMVHEVNHPNFKVMIDTTAMGVSEESVWDWFRVFGADIKNTHFIDGTPFGHLAWGDGSCSLDDMLRCFNQYDYTGPLGLEIIAAQYLNDPSAADLRTFRNLIRYADD